MRDGSRPPWKNVLDKAQNYWSEFKNVGPFLENSHSPCHSWLRAWMVASWFVEAPLKQTAENMIKTYSWFEAN